MPDIGRHTRRAALGLAVALAPVAGHAAMVTFEFEATFSDASADLIGLTGGFGGISGSFTFDDATADIEPSTGDGIYPGAIGAFSLSDAATGNGASATSGNIETGDAPSGDLFNVLVPSIASSSYGAATLTDFSLFLRGDDSLLSSDALPTTPPSVGAPGDDTIFLTFLADDGFTELQALYDLTSLTLGETSPGDGGGDSNVVPLPAALPLLLGGLAAFGAARAARRA